MVLDSFSSSLNNVWFYFILIVNELVLIQLFWHIEQCHEQGGNFGLHYTLGLELIGPH